MLGILVSFWEGLFSGAMLVSGRVTSYNYMSRWLCFIDRSSCCNQNFWWNMSHGFGFVTSFHFVWEGPGTWLHFCSQNLSQSHTFIQSPKTIPKPTRGPQSPYFGEISLFFHRCPDDGLTIIFDSRVGLTLTVTESTPPNVAPWKNHFKTKECHPSFRWSCVFLEGFTTLRDSTYFWSSDFFFVGEISGPLIVAL